MKLLLSSFAMAFALTWTPVHNQCSAMQSAQAGQIVCCCVNPYGQQCCNYVWSCPGPIPGCPCVS